MRRRIKKVRRTVRIPVASMGDIAFLLIIFFMLASEFNKSRDLPMKLPRSSQVKKIEASIAARVDIDEEGRIYLDGNPVNNAKEVGVGIEAMLQGTISDLQRHVQLRCDASQTREVYQPVLQAIAEAGGVVEAVGELE